jgi:hypothetical protein
MSLHSTTRASVICAAIDDILIMLNFKMKHIVLIVFLEYR